MNKLRRRSILAMAFAFAATSALNIAPFMPCRAQSKETVPPPGVPASLWVPDRFERAVRNQSTGPSYLMATIVNDTTGESKRVCLEGPELFEAVRIENNLGRGWGGSRKSWDKAMRLILDNPTYTYHFKNVEAWKIVQRSETSENLTMVQSEVKGQSAEELARRFDGRHSPGGFFTGDLRPGNMAAYSAAFAYVLTERGLYVGRGDAGNSLYVITPKIIADEEKERQKIDKNYHEQRKREEAEGRAFAARLPGYFALTQQFILTDARVAEDFGQEPYFSSGLKWKSPHLISSVDWINPIKKARKARYDWNQFLPAANHVARLAQKHPWLHAWKKAGPNRRIEAQLFGKTPLDASDDTLHKDVIPAWKDAGLGGAPYCELTLRWEDDGESAWAVVYLPPPGAGEIRALIARTHLPKYVTGTGAFWLDRLSFGSWAADNPRECVVVSPNGAWKRVKLPLRTPLHP